MCSSDLKYSNGLDDSPVMRSDYVSPVKSIGHGITTMQDLENNAEVWCVMLELVQEIGTKLRTHKKTPPIWRKLHLRCLQGIINGNTRFVR